MKKFLILCVLLIISVNCAYSNLQFSKISDVEVVNFPFCRAKVKILENGKTVKINESNFIVQEMHYSTRGSSVTDNGDGTYYLNWVSRLPSKFTYVDIFITYNDEVAYNRFRLPVDYKMRDVRIITSTGKPFEYFDTPQPNDSTCVPITFKAYPDSKEGQTDTLKIDSIKTHTPFFSYVFQGGWKNWNPPPGYYFEGDYLGYLYFKGHENKIYTDKLTIYFNGNQKSEIDLIGNQYLNKVKNSNTVTILQPKPNEVLTPCFLDTVIWTGGARGVQYIVDFSDNSGITWSNLGTTLDTFLVWTVAGNITEKALIRVYQKFVTQNNTILIDNFGFSNSKYENAAKYITASTYQGRLSEYKLNNNGNPVDMTSYILTDNNDSTNQIITTGIVYTKSDADKRELAATFHSSWINEFFAKDTLKIFRNDQSNAFKTIVLDFITKKIDADFKKQYLAVLPNNSNLLYIYETKEYSLYKTLKFTKPVSDFKFVPSGDSLVVVLMDNTVCYYNVGNFIELNSQEYYNLATITSVANSPDGKFTAFGTMRAPTEYLPPKINYPSYISPIYIFDNKGINIKTFYSNTHTPLGLDFNPNSDRIVSGKPIKDHITMRDFSSEMPADYFNFSDEDSKMLNYSFAAEGHYISAIMEDKKLYINKFKYPEYGVMDSTFKIRYTYIDAQPIVLQNQLLDYKTDNKLQTSFCNKGELPIIINSANLKTNWIFRLKPVLLPDTLHPGDCLTFDIEYFSLDTGKISDTLIVRSCAQDFYIPITSAVLPRNITYYNEEYDLGEVCVNTSVRKKIKLLRNNDTIPYNIQKVELQQQGNSEMKLVSSFQDISVMPGEDYYIEVEFTPQKKIDYVINFTIQNSHNWKFWVYKKIKGTGIGADIQLSHQNLTFISEIKKRTVVIKNLDTKPFTLTGYKIEPEGFYRVTDVFPKTLATNDSIILEVERLTESIPPAALTFISDPCGSNSRVNILSYNSSSVLSIIDTEADPRGEATIRIKLDNKEDIPYQGHRFLESEFTIDEKIFLPFKENSVLSGIGQGTLLRNEVINGKRFIKFKVEGDFPKEGIIAEIRGYAGLTLPSESAMQFTEHNLNFGKNVNTEFKTGKFKLINLCGDKMLIWNKPNMIIKSISPNPSDNYVNIDLFSEIETDLNIEIYNQAGAKLMQINNLRLLQGKNKIKINTLNLESGTFNAVIKSSSDLLNFKFTVIR